MIRAASAFFIGALFAVGLGVARLTLPETIQNSLDFFGRWDASMFVAMFTGMAVYGIFRLVARGRAAPLMAGRFRLPSQGWPTGRMFLGAVLFGAGWGYSGICPGPSLTASLTSVEVGIFALAMVAGVSVYERWGGGQPPKQSR